MEFKIAVDELQQIFNKLGNVVRQTEDNIVGMVYIEAKDELCFKATNGSISIVIKAFSATVIEEGSALFKFRDLKGYVSKFKPFSEESGTKEFHFLIAKTGLVKAKTYFNDGKSSYHKLHFDIYNIAMFPAIQFNKQYDLVLNSSILKSGIVKTLQMVNPSEIRRALASLYVKIYNDKIVFVGTDGVRLAEYIISVQTTMDEKIVLFSYNLASVLRNLLDVDKQVFIKFGSKYAYLQFDNIFLSGSLIVNEEYPDYKSLLTNITHTYRFPRLAVYDTLKTISDTFDTEDDNRVVFEFSSNKLYIRTLRSEVGYNLDYDVNTPFSFAVNGILLGSVLEFFMSDNIEICINDELKFVIFKSDEEYYTTLVSTLKMV